MCCVFVICYAKGLFSCILLQKQYKIIKIYNNTFVQTSFLYKCPQHDGLKMGSCITELWSIELWVRYTFQWNGQHHSHIMKNCLEVHFVIKCILTVHQHEMQSTIAIPLVYSHRFHTILPSATDLLSRSELILAMLWGALNWMNLVVSIL